ncbi:putative Methylmalonic aciduria type A protein, mitochondrial [Nannochloris sp. 'desiccata']|nr:putative Methylmalonic aciduria type A protein, mitochondrial [Chlorella desiccata (nom. nud.)]
MQNLAQAVRAGNRMALSKALTLIESSKPEHEKLALECLHYLQTSLKNHPVTALSAAATAPSTALGEFRIGISGPPGAGKSSLIESMGCSLVEKGEKVAVLAVDPSSVATGGSILGDKTRMSKLSILDEAYVRPSPTRGTLGGVSRTTSEAMVVCAAAGYSRILIETVGVGQSEIAVGDLVDCMVLVLPPVGGDELQSIKRGITEVADIIVVNKADGQTRSAAGRAAASFKATLHLRPPRKRSWIPVVLPVSAHTGDGMDALEVTLDDYWRKMSGSGELSELRERQRAKVAWTATQELLLEKFRRDPRVKQLYQKLLPDITAGYLGPRNAAVQLVDYFQKCGES